MTKTHARELLEAAGFMALFLVVWALTVATVWQFSPLAK